jgi:hypothetical protein
MNKIETYGTRFKLPTLRRKGWVELHNWVDLKDPHEEEM